MTNTGTKDYTIKRLEIILRNLFYLTTLLFNFVIICFIILFVPLIDIYDLESMNELQNIITFPFIISLAIIGMGIVVNQKFLIPRSIKIQEPYFRFRLHMVCLFIAIETTVILSLIMIFFPFQNINTVLWSQVLILFVLLFFYLLYFYLFYYHPTLTNIEAGKIVRIKAKKMF